MLATASVFAGGEAEEEQGLPSEMTVAVWSGNAASGLDSWRADNIVDAAARLEEEFAAEGQEIAIETEPFNDSAGWGDYKRKFALSAEDGSAPEIVVSGHEDVAPWAQAGYIVPIADSIEDAKDMYPEFDDVIDSLWDATTWRGQVWAVPQDTEARPMYFSKPKLRELGWSEDEIASLPQRIEEGEFTLDDMIETAKQAVEEGVVEEGYGYWHRPSKGGDFVQYYVAYGGEMYDAEEDKLVITEDALEDFYSFQRRVVEEGITPENYIGTAWNVWHNTVTSNEALFWNGGSWQWGEWVADYVESEEWLFENVGYALQPSGIEGEPGGTLSHPLVYMVTSERASDHSNQDLMKRLVAYMTTTELNTRHALKSAHLAILESQKDYPEYEEAEFLASVTYMLDYNYFQPNHTGYGMWFEAVWSGMVNAQQGEKDPAQAAADTVAALERELGDQIIVE
jgi:inositol-phosphate transport system substrate-binding protein